MSQRIDKKAEKKKILDASCGGRMFWFNKKHPNAIYIDNRIAKKGHEPHQPNHSVEPDIVMDFRAMKFKDKTFNLIVFDPPHFMGMSPKSWLAKKYGILNREIWRDDIRKGFDECWRVLKKDGVLIVKWSEDFQNKSRSISISEFIKVVGREPLFGHRTGTRSNTHWLCFMKI